jgi:hypothetical protein
LGIRVESKSILHCPQSRKGLGQLLDNLHYYFSVTLSRILDEMHRNPNWGINEAILSCQNRYKYLIALLKTNPYQLCISNFFPHPEVEVNTTLLVRLTLSKGCDPWRWEEGTGSTLEADKPDASRCHPLDR